jgi:hypothetical protein
VILTTDILFAVIAVCIAAVIFDSSLWGVLFILRGGTQTHDLISHTAQSFGALNRHRPA